MNLVKKSQISFLQKNYRYFITCLLGIYFQEEISNRKF